MKFKLYHGSDNKIDKFVIANEFMIDETIMKEGPGIYLTTSFDDARQYGKFIYEVEWKPKKLLSTKKARGTEANLYWLSTFIKFSPDWKDDAMNWNEDPIKGLRMAVESIIESYETPKERYEQVWYDFYRNDPALYCQKMANRGYDGFIIDRQEGVKHAIVFNPTTLVILNVIKREEIKEIKSTMKNINQSVHQLGQLTNKKIVLKEAIDNPDIMFHEVLNQTQVDIMNFRYADPKLINQEFDVDSIIFPINWTVDFEYKKAGINGYSINAKVAKIDVEIRIWTGEDNENPDDTNKSYSFDVSGFNIIPELKFSDEGTLYLNNVVIDFKTKIITLQ